VAPVDFSLVCFRFAPEGVSETERDEINQSIMHAVNAGGEAYLSHTKLNGRIVLRFAIGNIRTTHAHVLKAWGLLKAEARRSQDAKRPTAERAK